MCIAYHCCDLDPRINFRVMMVAKKFLDAGHQLNFAVANRKAFAHEVTEFNLDASAGDVPVVGIKTAKGDKYVMQEEFT